MAQLPAQRILDTIDSVLTEGLGSVRTISASTYLAGAYANQETSAASQMMLTKARAEARITSVERHEASPSVLSTHQLYAFSVDVMVDRFFSLEAAVSSATRRAAHATASEDSSVISQALEWHRNVSQTNDASPAPTYLVSGQLVWRGSEIGDYEIVDDKSGRIRSVHRFTGIATVVTAVS